MTTDTFLSLIELIKPPTYYITLLILKTIVL